MTSQLEELLQKALALPAEERAFVIAALEQSLAREIETSPRDALAADDSAAPVATPFCKNWNGVRPHFAPGPPLPGQWLT